MSFARQVLAWAWRAWPAIVLLLIAVLHFCALELLPAQSILVNKATGTIFQIAGGLIVLHSLDGNLGLFRKQSLRSAFVLWLQQFPKRSVTAMVGSVGMVSEFNVAASLRVGRAVGSSLEERVAELERRLGEVAQQMGNVERTLGERVSALKTELSASVAQVDASLRDLSHKVEHAAIGGLRQQLFGVLLAIYGAVVSVFA